MNKVNDRQRYGRMTAIVLTLETSHDTGVGSVSASVGSSRCMRTTSSARHPHAQRDPSPFRVPLFLFGVGLGGFVDGIVLHQILQWHHMISDTNDGRMDTVAGLERNTLADGLFHLFAFAVVLVALYLAMRAGRANARAVLPSWGVVTGWLLVGWATFNLVEGIIDHHLLTVHHVRDDVAHPLVWDLAFLGISIVLLPVGLALVRRGRTG
jgi:uncharacterized membrane protein